MKNILSQKVEYENKDNIKLSRYQKNLVIRIIKGHVENPEYFFEWAKVHVNKYFVAIGLYYYPRNAIGNPYVNSHKNFWIGPKGAIKKATTKTGIGKEHNIKKIAEYYFKAED